MPERGRRGRPRSRKTNEFAQWIDGSGMSREQVAHKLKVTHQHIDRLCCGDRRPDLDLAFFIEDFTSGAVTARSWAKKPKPYNTKKRRLAKRQVD